MYEVNLNSALLTNDYLHETIAANDLSLRTMAGTIRTMDQHIYNMSQCTSWSDMRPHFNKLQHDAELRMKAESSRITDSMRTELLSTYTQPATKGLLPNGK